MNLVRFGIPVALVAVVVLLAEPSSAAQDAISVNLVPVTLPSTEVGTIENTDEDAYDEVNFRESFGSPCGCYCPVVGAGLDLAAAGQRVTFSALTAMGACGTIVAATVNPADPNLGARPYFDPEVTLDFAGLSTGEAALR